MNLTISRQTLGASAKTNKFNNESDNLVIRPGTQVLVLGESATGKTSLAMSLAGLVNSPDELTPVLFGSDDLYLMDPRKRALLVGFVPTRPISLFSGLTTTVERELRLSLALLELDESAFEKEKHRGYRRRCARDNPATFTSKGKCETKPSNRASKAIVP